MKQQPAQEQKLRKGAVLQPHSSRQAQIPTLRPPYSLETAACWCSQQAATLKWLKLDPNITRLPSPEALAQLWNVRDNWAVQASSF